MNDTKQKTFSMLREFVGKDQTMAPIATSQAVDDVDNAAGAFSVEDSVNLDKLNGYVSDIQNGQYINPYYALNRVWSKLQMIGLGFDLKKATFMSGPNGVLTLPLTQFGGRYGYLDNTGHITKDDGITSRVPGGMSIVIRWVNTSGIYSLTATLKRNNDSEL